MWVARQSFSEQFEEVQAALSTARDQGLQHLEEIAEQESSQIQLSPSQCLTYLRDNLHFQLGSQEEQGLKLFFDQAQKLDLLPSRTF